MEFKVTWEEVQNKVDIWVESIISEYDMVVGVSRGGIIPAYMLANKVGMPVRVVEPFVEGGLKEFKGKKILMVDDIEDTGATLRFFGEQAHKYELADFVSRVIVKKNKDGEVWYVFPWETESDTVGGREQATVAILRSIGENPMREGLVDTPKRVAKMWGELTAGYNQKPADVLKTTFSKGEYDEIIVLRNIPFHSLCEHHLLVFSGEANFGYIPDKKIVGLSKLARLVEVFSRRLQIQEKMTVEIAKAFEEHLQPKAVGLVIDATHMCMVTRGIKKENAIMTTSYLGGAFREKPEARAEFFKLIGK